MSIFMFTTTRNGVAAKELQRQLGVTHEATITGMHISVLPKHLSKYAKEWEFGLNCRENREFMLRDVISRFPGKDA